MGSHEVTVGVVANPASGRDIRRVVAQASVFPTAEKTNMVQRMLTAFGAFGVERVLLSTDLGGISAAMLRAVQSGRSAAEQWPEVEFCDEVELTDSALDTTNTVRSMLERGADAIVCLGGDGTARVAASACGDVPLLPVSTGTNNAFPQMREATVAGVALALVARGKVACGTQRAGMLEVELAGRVEKALVDVCVSTETHIGSRALWHPATLAELYCTFAEPDGIGLSSIPGLLCPSPRTEPEGVALRFAPPERARQVVYAPIGPGLIRPVGVRDWRPLAPFERCQVAVGGGVIAVDGERELECLPGQTATVTLRPDGPRCVDVTAVLAEAARAGLLRADVSPCQRFRKAGQLEVP